MSKPRIEDCTKHTLLLFTGDYKRLQDAYPELGAAQVIRQLVRAHLNKIDPPLKPSDLPTGVDL